MAAAGIEFRGMVCACTQLPRSYTLSDVDLTNTFETVKLVNNKVFVLMNIVEISDVIELYELLNNKARLIRCN
jgi:hypothetical protein